MGAWRLEGETMSISRKTISIMAVSLGLLGGCATPEYSCPAPEHGMCKSISDVYTARTNSIESDGGGEKDAPRRNEPASNDQNAGTVPARGFSPYPLVMKPGDPIRREARVIRLWIAPWVDAKGDYYDQSYLYTEIDRGEWLLQERLRALQSETRVVSPKEEVAHD